SSSCTCALTAPSAGAFLATASSASASAGVGPERHPSSTGMIRVGVVGAAGRMGRTVCEAVAADPALSLVAAVDPQHAGLDLRSVARFDSDRQVSAGLGVLVDAGAEVVVDFTVIEASRETLAFAAANGLHAV